MDLYWVAGGEAASRAQHAQQEGGDEVGGAALRLLHQLVASPAGAEAVARAAPPAPTVLLGAMQAWGIAGTALALETLKRSLGTGVQSRDLVVGSALACRLLDRLLALLDWRAESSSPAGPQVPLPLALLSETDVLLAHAPTGIGVRKSMSHCPRRRQHVQRQATVQHVPDPAFYFCS